MSLALIVDPLPENRFVLGHLVQSAGYSPDMVGSGREGAQLFSNEVYDLAIINANITDMHAVDLARRLRRRMEAENFAVSARVICIVSCEAERDAFPDFLVDEFLITPVYAETLKSSIGGHVAPLRAESAISSPDFNAIVIHPGEPMPPHLASVIHDEGLAPPPSSPPAHIRGRGGDGVSLAQA